MNCRRALIVSGLLGITGLLAFACDTATSEQRCDPKTNQGCQRAQACAVDATGTALCTSNSGEVEEGGTCLPPSLTERVDQIDGTTRCSAGLGCISHLGLSRCARFCAPGADESQCTDGSEHPMAAYSSCTLLLDGRADTGLCALPCQLAGPDPAMCPEGSQCLLVAGAATAACGVGGERESSQTCGPSCSCGPGLVCVADRFGNVCRVAVESASLCADQETAVVLPGTRNPVPVSDADGGAAPYVVCAPCRVITSDGLSLCGSSAACTDDGGQVARVDPADAIDVSQALGLAADDAIALVGATRSPDGGWVWSASGDAVSAAVWADGIPPEEGACAGLTVAGHMVALSECTQRALCRFVPRTPCPEEG